MSPGSENGDHEHHQRESTCPKIMQIDGSAEFWQARASLVVTDGAGQEVALPSKVRAYLITGTNHGEGTAAPFYAFCANTPSPRTAQSTAAGPARRPGRVGNARNPTARERRYPSLRNGTLAPTLPRSELGFPVIPGVTYSGLFNYLFVTDYSVQPPTTESQYLVPEPKVDEDGNDLAGIRQPIVSAPVATYTGWNLRRPGDAGPDLCSGAGSMFPFPATQADRLASGDPRLSIEERYPTHQAYVEAVRRRAAALVRDRLLLAEDARAIIAEAEASNIGR